MQMQCKYINSSWVTCCYSYAEDHVSELEAPMNRMWSSLKSKKEESNSTPALEVIAVFMRDVVNQWGNKAREA